MVKYKSTRDIAKEAVEDEVKRAGKGKRKRDVDSSDDDDDDDFKNKDKRQTRKYERNTKSNEPSDLNRLAGKYRDRAKERQDGIQSDETVNVAMSNRSMLYDEIFDSVVAAVESGDRQKLNRITTSIMSSSTVGGTIPVTAKDAIKWIENTQNAAKTVLGKEILKYLRKQYLKPTSNILPVSAAGRMLQNSVRTFRYGIHIDPRDRHWSWERPAEQTFATSTTTTTTTTIDSNDSRDYTIPKASVVGQGELLQKIQQCFDQRNRRRQRAEVRSKASEESNSVPVADNHQTNVDESDDDIFASVGEYIPDNDDGTTNDTTSMMNSYPGANNPKTESIFGDNITTAATEKAYQSDQDMESDDKLSVPVIPKSLKGSSSLHPGGYDDDDGIGLDFDGPMYDDDNDDDASRNSKEKKLTKKRGSKKLLRLEQK